VGALSHERSKECPVANNKNPNEKQPGENEDGNFHYNPGNMSGKNAGEEASEKKNQGDKLRSRDKLPERLS
jgi:hypothetical protein